MLYTARAKDFCKIHINSEFNHTKAITIIIIIIITITRSQHKSSANNTY